MTYMMTKETNNDVHDDKGEHDRNARANTYKTRKGTAQVNNRLTK